MTHTYTRDGTYLRIRPVYRVDDGPIHVAHVTDLTWHAWIDGRQDYHSHYGAGDTRAEAVAALLERLRAAGVEG